MDPQSSTAPQNNEPTNGAQPATPATDTSGVTAEPAATNPPASVVSPSTPSAEQAATPPTTAESSGPATAATPAEPATPSASVAPTSPAEVTPPVSDTLVTPTDQLSSAPISATPAKAEVNGVFGLSMRTVFIIAGVVVVALLVVAVYAYMKSK